MGDGALARISREEVRNLGLASLGATLEYYDFVVYVFVAAALSQVMFPPDMTPWLRQVQVFSIYAIGYFIRPLAGLLIAHLADRIGRKRLFVFTVLLMSVPTFLMGLSPTYSQVGIWAPLALLVLRLLQGCAVGGELPSAAVFVSEHAQPRRLFLASGTLHGVVHCGLLLGAGSAAAASWIASTNPALASLSWRLPFLLGGVFGLTAAYLRRQLEETPLFAKLRKERRATPRVPLGVVLKNYRGACLFGLGVMFMQSVTSSVYLQYVSTYLITQFSFAPSTVFLANTVCVFSLALSMPLWGAVCDRLGPGRTIGIGAALCAGFSIWFFNHLPATQGSTWPLALSLIPVGISGACTIAILPGLVASLFPTEVRQTGYALPYNFGSAIFSGPGPLVLAWSVRTYGVTAPMYVILLACAVAGTMAVMARFVPRYLGVWNAARNETAAAVAV